MLKKAVPYVFVAAVFLLLACNNVLTRGMFMDGLIYSSVADNMAHGIGDFWHPCYTQTIDTYFNGHPPLMMWLLRLWFRIVGTSMLAAKCYALLMVLAAAVLMVVVWRLMGFGQRTGWVPLLLWVMIFDVPLLSCNNFLESTMLVFVLAAVAFALRGSWWNLAAGAMLFLAFMTKGPTGLFPLAMPLLLWLFGRVKGFWRMAGGTALMAAGAAVPMAAMLLLSHEAGQYMHEYLQQQVMHGMQASLSSRGYVVEVLFSRSALALSIVAVAVIASLVGKGQAPAIDAKHWNNAGLMFVLTLCGTLPMMVSTKQYPHYLLTVYPCMALAAAALVEPWAVRWQKDIESRGGVVVAVVFLAAALVLNVLHIGKAGRDKALLHDMDEIMTQVEDGEVVTIPNYLLEHYNLHGYFYFYHHVSLDYQEPHEYLITDRDTPLPAAWDTLYREVPLPTEQYHIYELVAE